MAKPDTECIRWTGKFYATGYGRVGYKMAHRLVYEKEVGPIPDGLQIDHLCRNRWCVNSEHLEPVTIKENVLRGEGFAAINKRKTHCNSGHEFTVANTYIRKDRPQRRECRICRYQAVKKHLIKERG